MSNHINIPFIITIIWMHLKDFLPKIQLLLKRFNVEKKLENLIEEKMKSNMSRKLFLLYVVIILATLGTFVPPTLTWVFHVLNKNSTQFEILGSTEWVSMMSLVVSAYFGTNVWEKHVAISNGLNPKELDAACMQIKGSSTTSTSQDSDKEKEALKDALKHNK